jgi:hypothetical protein
MGIIAPGLSVFGSPNLQRYAVMKFDFPKVQFTEKRWNVLAIVFACLTGLVCILYAVIFAYPKILPMQLQVPTKTPTSNSPAVSAEQVNRSFPTFPAEWTAVFATRSAEPPANTPTALAALSSTPAGLTVSVTLTAEVPISPSPTLLGSEASPTLTPPTEISTSSSPVATEATATLPAPDTPLPTDTPPGYTGYFAPDWTPTPYPPGYPENP